MTITNDGATILKLLEVEHPAAKILCELADLQDQEVGDGTTSVVSEVLPTHTDAHTTHMHTYTHAPTPMYVHTNTCVCTHVQAHMPACSHTLTHTLTHTCSHAC